MRNIIVVVMIIGYLGGFGFAQEKRLTAVAGKYELLLSPEEIQKRLKRYAPAVLAPVAGQKLDLKTVNLLAKLVEAGQAVEKAYWEQVSEDGLDIMENLSIQPDEVLKDYVEFLKINYGPWDRMADNEPFIGRMAKPDGANFYPRDLSRREFEKWVADHPEDKDAFTSPYTVIRRSGSGLISIPYSKKYSHHLSKAAKALREAAEMTECPNLAKFLEARAEAFETNDYFKSEMLWMDVGECNIEIAIGPYEFYEDRLMGYKAAFAVIVGLRDYAESARFAKLSQYAEELMKNLPISDDIKQRIEFTKGSPIIIANEVYAGGDYRARFQVRAYVLPNDERVRVAKGTRHVVLKNVIEAKAKHVLWPIAKLVLAEEQLPSVSAEAQFKFLLMWQLAHGITPKLMELPGGGRVQPRMLLRQRHAVIESARAEAVGLLNAVFLVEKGILPQNMKVAMPVTHLASIFETLRLGTSETYGLAKLIVYNYLSALDVYHYDPTTKRFSVKIEKLADGLKKLVEELITIEVMGDYDRAGKMIVEYGIIPAEVRAKLEEVSSLPIDILPKYGAVIKQ